VNPIPDLSLPNHLFPYIGARITVRAKANQIALAKKCAVLSTEIEYDVLLKTSVGMGVLVPITCFDPLKLRAR
jgi:hypothetical protein